MAEKKDKQNQEKKKGFWWWLLVIIAVLIILNALNKSSQIDDYNYCVDDCVYDVQSCMDYPYFLSDEYIKESDVSECLDELESCITDCEVNYGN